LKKQERKRTGRDKATQEAVAESDWHLGLGNSNSTSSCQCPRHATARDVGNRQPDMGEGDLPATPPSGALPISAPTRPYRSR